MTARDDEYNADVSDEEVAQADARREAIPHVRRALEIIEPAPEERSRCGYEIATGAGGFELLLHYYDAFAGRRKTKRVARSAIAALRRIEHVIPQLDFLVPIEGALQWTRDRGWFHGDGFPLGEVRKWRETLEKIENTPAREVVRDNVLRKHLAVVEAHRLLSEFSSARITAARNGKFCSLAAVLFGNEDTNLSSQCRAHIRKVISASKK